MNSPLSLTVPFSLTYLPVVTGFVETAATTLGLSTSEASAATLAAEEIFHHLCQFLPPSENITIACLFRSYYLQVDFTIPAREFDLKAFNLTTTLSPESQEDLDQMGLLLASRAVDRLSFNLLKGGQSKLTLIKEKTYPEARGSGSSPVPPLTTYRLRNPEPAEIALIVELINENHLPESYPRFFRMPGRVVDLIASGEGVSVAAFGPTGLMAGALFWQWAGSKTVNLYGPYLFGEQPDGQTMAEKLLEYCLNSLARTDCLSVVSRYYSPWLPVHHFQPLGRITAWDQEGVAQERTVYLRLLGEDSGHVVITHPQISEFLRKEYKRLVLPRDVQEVTLSHALPKGHSVLASHVDRLRKQVTLEPLVPGGDLKENLNNHLIMFRKEGLPAVFFIIDLGRNWQMDFVPAILGVGFSPRMVLPDAGQGDQLIFQLGPQVP